MKGQFRQYFRRAHLSTMALSKAEIINVERQTMFLAMVNTRNLRICLDNLIAGRGFVLRSNAMTDNVASQSIFFRTFSFDEEETLQLATWRDVLITKRRSSRQAGWLLLMHKSDRNRSTCRKGFGNHSGTCFDLIPIRKSLLT